MSYEAPRTDITFEGERIVQLDVHVPEVLPGEIFVGIDLGEFSRRYPLQGGVTVNQNINGDSEGCVLAQISRENDTLNMDDDVDPAEYADRPDSLIINQHIGRIGSNGLAIGVTTYNIKDTILDAPAAVEDELAVQELLEEHSHPN